MNNSHYRLILKKSEICLIDKLFWNPSPFTTLLTLAAQRDNIDCGGLEYLIIRYGNFFQFVLPTPRGHVSVCIEKNANPVSEAATPLTNIRYTGNPEGAIYGYEQSMENAYMTRLDQRTPFKDLYLASASTRPGGGYQPCLGSGVDAFKVLVKDLADI